MVPFELRGDGLVLDRPRTRDISLIAEYCNDPLFEANLSTPWPYSDADARKYVEEFVPCGWLQDSEWVWAIRRESDGPLLGVISLRLPSGYLGYWLGEPHRGHGIMSKCVELVTTAAFERTGLSAVQWEARVGNGASLNTVLRCGYTQTEDGPGVTRGRDGEVVNSWKARVTRDEWLVCDP